VYRKGYRGTRVFRVRGDNKIIRGKPKKIEINLYKNDRTSKYMPILYVHWLLACVCRLGWLIRQAQQPRLTGGGVVEWLLRRRSRVFVNISTREYKTRRPVCLCAVTLHSLLSRGLEHWTAVFRHRSEWLSEWMTIALYAAIRQTLSVSRGFASSVRPRLIGGQERISTKQWITYVNIRKYSRYNKHRLIILRTPVNYNYYGERDSWPG